MDQRIGLVAFLMSWRCGMPLLKQRARFLGPFWLSWHGDASQHGDGPRKLAVSLARPDA